MDSGTFKLLTKLPWGDLMSYDCPSKATAAQIKQCLYFYDWVWGGSVVTATFYDAEGFEISAPVEGGSGIYDIEAVDLMTDQATTLITYTPVSTTSVVEVQNSEEIQRSSPPLRGRMYIECTDPNGVVS